jgi:hypothetical protein
VQVGRVTVIAPAALVSLGVAMGERADQPAAWMGLGRRDPLPMRLVVVPDEAAFTRISRGRVPGWGVGLALPAARTIVVRADAPDPMAALRHELAHLALHGALAGRVRVPLWFDEGYAVVAAGEWDRFDALQLNLTVARGRVGNLWTLDASLRRGPVEAETAYALAGAAVLHLARLHPAGTLDALIGRLLDGEDFPAAVLASTGYTVDGFDAAWRRDLRTRYGLVVWLVAGGGWAALGLVVIGLAIWRRRRDQPRRAALDVGWAIPADEPEFGGESLDQDGPTR